MKNIHVLPTEKPSRIYMNLGQLFLEKEYSTSKGESLNHNIYITSDEEIKEGDYFIAYSVTIDKKPYISCASEYKERKKEKGKIILTTDVDLIKDGVQAIGDDFLEWFVKNPSCEEVEGNKIIPYNFDGLDSVRQDKFLELFHKSELFDEIKYNDAFDWSVNEGKDFLKLYPTYKIFIPKEEPKQETLEEVGTYQQELFNYLHDLGVIALQSEMQEIERIVLSMQQERMYSDVTRVEVIQHSEPYNGRAYSNYNAREVEVQLQDDGKTLKIFLK